MKTHIAINGACGRMGQRLVALAAEEAGLQVVAAVDSPRHPRAGHDAGEVAGITKTGVLVGQAMVEDAVILSRDPNIARYPVTVIW